MVLVNIGIAMPEVTEPHRCLPWLIDNHLDCTACSSVLALTSLVALDLVASFAVSCRMSCRAPSPCMIYADVVGKTCSRAELPPCAVAVDDEVPSTALRTSFITK